jgi:hypothetical protein
MTATRSGADTKRTGSLTGVETAGDEESPRGRWRGLRLGTARLNVGGPAHGERDGEAEAVCTDRGTTVKLVNDGARLTEEDRGGGVSPGDGDPTRRQ